MCAAEAVLSLVQRASMASLMQRHTVCVYSVVIHASCGACRVPRQCPAIIAQLIEQCQARDPKERPTAAEVLHHLVCLQEQGECMICVCVNLGLRVRIGPQIPASVLGTHLDPFQTLSPKLQKYFLARSSLQRLDRKAAYLNSGFQPALNDPQSMLRAPARLEGTLPTSSFKLRCGG